ncbi:hypothetical protein H5V45_05365 [Nocardioides sp. KIGAM211]|uniref:Uncharacterized protein n=1 Tax=Nocardioides luti TaxID=2761101 RepID=A0A7X0REG6_9ACTN|nr:hypothetical protein [Nocardioides luti]MBB6626747.1 hypothetical protein [Nocardioides luti]
MTATLATFARRTAVVLVALAAPLALAGPAGADVPEGWSQNPEDVSTLHALLVLGGIPVLLFLLIVAAVYVPALIRGESVTPGGAEVEDQWFGGPRKGTAELAGPDTDESKAGGASGRW